MKGSNFFSEDYFFDKKSSNYDDYFRFDNDQYWKTILDSIKKHDMHGSVLEVGCAFGFFVKRLKPLFRNVYGTDISKYALGEARKIVPDGLFSQVDLNREDLPFKNDSFDLVCALDVLEHTKSIDKSLKKIIPKIKKRGFLIISLPINNTLSGKIFALIDKDPTHISVPSEEELLKIIHDNRLEVIEKSYFTVLGIPGTPLYKIKGIKAEIELVLRKRS